MIHSTPAALSGEIKHRERLLNPWVLYFIFTFREPILFVLFSPLFLLGAFGRWCAIFRACHSLLTRCCTVYLGAGNAERERPFPGKAWRRGVRDRREADPDLPHRVSWCPGQQCRTATTARGSTKWHEVLCCTSRVPQFDSATYRRLSPLHAVPCVFVFLSPLLDARGRGAHGSTISAGVSANTRTAPRQFSMPFCLRPAMQEAWPILPAYESTRSATQRKEAD